MKVLLLILFAIGVLIDISKLSVAAAKSTKNDFIIIKNEVNVLRSRRARYTAIDPDCDNGLLVGRVCCHRACGKCGGRGCGRRQGGAKHCCPESIRASGRTCVKSVAPCMRPTDEPPLYADYGVQEDYIPIFTYHKIGGRNSSVTTSVERFKEHMKYLTTVAKCNWITMERLSEYVERKEKLPTNACVLVFDDGIKTQYHDTLCSLNKYKIPATFYLPTSFIDWRKYYMTWEEVGKLAALGHDIESHTVHHVFLPKLNYTEQMREIVGCKTDLEKRGYTVKTFAYPLGGYNNDTLAILKRSNYTLARDTRVDDTWKEPKAITIGADQRYLLHFYYIRPEFETGKELWQRVGYTGWWQFEDNYVITRGNKKTVAEKKGQPRFLATSTSYGIVMLSRNTEIAVQFLTKYKAGFTLYIVVSLRDKAQKLELRVDGVKYTYYTSQNKYEAPTMEYIGYFVNIRTLLPGVHTLKIKNVSQGGRMIYVDKYRLFSDVSQDFSERLYYKQCQPRVDDYCQCDDDQSGDDEEVKDNEVQIPE